MKGGIYYVLRKNYKNFVQTFIRLAQQQNWFTMDLSAAVVHSIVLDIDTRLMDVSEGWEEYCQYYLQRKMIPVLKHYFFSFNKNFTMIVARREGAAGIHIHLPEFEITHDDYFNLCTLLQEELHFLVPQKIEFRLDIVRNFNLANSGKPNQTKYKPVAIYYFDEDETHILDMTLKNLNPQFALLHKKFKKSKTNADSYFRKLFLLDLFSVKNQIFEYMMPVSSPYSPVHKISYFTDITSNEENDNELVATFVYKESIPTYIFKSKELKRHNTLTTYNYLKLNAALITQFVSSNHALKLWYKRHKKINRPVPNDIFKTINQTIKSDNYKFISDPNPIRTLMEHNEGYYFLPCFYALCNIQKMDSRTLIRHLRVVLEGRLSSLLDALEKINPKIIEHIALTFQKDTILYCAANMESTEECMSDKLEAIVKRMQGVFSILTTSKQLTQHIRHIQQRYFPIVVGQLKHSTKKAVRLLWNFTAEYWQEMTSWREEIRHLIVNIWANVLDFLQENYPNLPKDIIKNVNTQFIISSVISETNLDRQQIHMNRHKWHIRTSRGVLCLLTGHICANVPEFYMTDHRLNISWPREHFTQFWNVDSYPKLRHIYTLFFDLRFFNRYLKNLFSDKTDNLFDTLTETLYESGISMDDLDDQDEPLVQSMMHFYIHLCKFMVFDFPRINFIMDVFASLFIATNYNRKFYLFKGRTRNGKSQLFQMLGNVLGGYGHTIRTINLQPNKNTLSAQPDLASTLFDRRLVCIEELSGHLDEGLIKDVTGNSVTAFRNLFEANMGGIPTAKLFACTNNYPMCIATDAFKDRIVAFPMEADFTDRAQNMSTSEQVIHDQYQKESDLTIQEYSREGVAICSLFRFIQKLNLVTGYFPVMAEPDCLLEFKVQILLFTDGYMKFIQAMDVQEIPEGVTSFTELKSAIRQFLKTIKNTTTIQETDLISRFDTQYAHLKKTETLEEAPLWMNDEDEGGDDDEEQILQESVAKMMKKTVPNPVMYYGVSIKNYKNTHT